VTVSEREIAGRPLRIDQGAADADPGDSRGPVAGVLLAVIRAYQMARWGRPTGCRFLPSCSEYAVGAIERHGAVGGSWLAVKRTTRCHPWGGHGADPVPDRRAPCLDH
jgi:hypothetical protein